jgi:ribose 5-phosphate isomerase B
MNVAVGADHRGADILTQLIPHLEQEGWGVQRLSECDGRTCDYPDMAYPVANAVAQGQASRGILVCGSGIGMCIAANKVPGVRAALVHDELAAEISRRHNDANVMCLAADLLGQRIIERIVLTWLATEFEGGRHARRVRKIEAMEAGQSPGSVADEASNAVE